MSVLVINSQGAKQAKKISVPETKLSAQTLARVLVVQQQNAKRHRPLVKTRGMVKFGGAKPWRQKGTGRARAGSYSSPLWRGGGIMFGPSGEPRRYKKISQSVRRAARISILGRTAGEGRLVVLAGTLALQKSKAAAQLRQKAGLDGSLLAVVSDSELEQTRGLRNLANAELTTPDDLTAADIAGAKAVLVTESAYREVVGAEPKKAAAKPDAKKARPQPRGSAPMAKRPAKKATRRSAAKAKKPSTKKSTRSSRRSAVAAKKGAKK